MDECTLWPGCRPTGALSMVPLALPVGLHWNLKESNTRFTLLLSFDQQFFATHVPTERDLERLTGIQNFLFDNWYPPKYF